MVERGAAPGAPEAAVGQADGEEALALDRDVERAVGALQNALAERAAGIDGGRAGSGADARGRRAARLRVDEVAEPDALVLVPGRVRVRQVVGDGIEALLLGGHAGGRGVETLKHASKSSA